MSAVTDQLQNVDYDTLDRAKNAFIAAGQKTLKFAERYGFVPGDRLGASANVFSINLEPFLQSQAKTLEVTLIPECLGTADDARPDDLTPEEAVAFWRNTASKTLSCITNDAASGAMQPVLFSLYLPSATPELVFNEQFLEGFLDGIVTGCRELGCVYFSGETPQLKSKMVPGTIDIAGAVFAVRPPGPALDLNRLAPGDQIVMLASSGPHENGYTMFRKLAGELPDGYRTTLSSGEEYWQALNHPSVLYSPIIQDIVAAGIQPTNLEPITGHGWQKLMRPAESYRYRIREMLPVPEVFSFIEQQTGSGVEEMLHKFNYGAGFAVFVRTKGEAEQVVKIAGKHDVAAVLAGEVEQSEQREVVVEPVDVTLKGDDFALQK